jgi:hypothetical protein
MVRSTFSDPSEKNCSSIRLCGHMLAKRGRSCWLGRLLEPLTVPSTSGRRSNDGQYRATSLQAEDHEDTVLGKETEHGDSPTLYATDQGTYLIQGWKVTDPEILAKLNVEGETVVEIYARLLTHLVNDGLGGAVVSWIPPIVHVKENANLIIQGKRVTDSDTVTEMNIPGHEDVVEVDKAAIEALFSEG